MAIAQKKIQIVTPKLKKKVLEEEKKSLKLNIPKSQYDNLIENASLMEIKPSELIMIALNATNIFDPQPKENDTGSTAE